MIKKIFFTCTPRPANLDVALLFLRVGIALVMLTHGIPKLLMLMGDDAIQFPVIFGDPGISLSLAVFAEFLCSLLVLLGLATRLAVLPLMITMLTAILHIHGTDPFAVKELPVLYLMVYLVLLILGSGKFSLDALIMNRRQPRL